MRQQEQQTHDVRNHHDELNHRDDPDRHDGPDQVHRPDSTFEQRDEEASGAYPADRPEAGSLDGAEPRDRVDEADRVDHVRAHPHVDEGPVAHARPRRRTARSSTVTASAS